MKTKLHLLILASFLAFAPVVFGQDTKASPAGGNAKAQGSQKVHQAVGVVKKVDAKTGTATIEHGPVPSLKWSGMTMPFGVKDPAVLAKLEVGKKIEFEFEHRGTEYVVVKVR